MNKSLKKLAVGQRKVERMTGLAPGSAAKPLTTKHVGQTIQAKKHGAQYTYKLNQGVKRSKAKQVLKEQIKTRPDRAMKAQQLRKLKMTKQVRAGRLGVLGAAGLAAGYGAYRMMKGKKNMEKKAADEDVKSHRRSSAVGAALFGPVGAAVGAKKGRRWNAALGSFVGAAAGHALPKKYRRLAATSGSALGAYIGHGGPKKKTEDQ